MQYVGRGRLHRPSKHLAARTVRTIQGTCWQAPGPDTRQSQASYMLTSCKCPGVTVSPPVGRPSPTLAPNSCSSFTIRSRAVPEESLCFPVWCRHPSSGLRLPRGPWYSSRPFTHSSIHSTPSRPLPMLSNTSLLQTNPRLTAKDTSGPQTRSLPPQGPLSGESA